MRSAVFKSLVTLVVTGVILTFVPQTPAAGQGCHPLFAPSQVERVSPAPWDAQYRLNKEDFTMKEQLTAVENAVGARLLEEQVSFRTVRYKTTDHKVYWITPRGHHPLNLEAKLLQSRYGAILVVSPLKIVTLGMRGGVSVVSLDNGFRGYALYMGLQQFFDPAPQARNRIMLHEKRHLRNVLAIEQQRNHSLLGEVQAIDGKLPEGSHGLRTQKESQYDQFMQFDELQAFYSGIRLSLLSLQRTLRQHGWNEQAYWTVKDISSEAATLHLLSARAEVLATHILRLIDHPRADIDYLVRDGVRWITGRVQIGESLSHFSIPLIAESRLESLLLSNPSKARKQVKSLLATSQKIKAKTAEVLFRFIDIDIDNATAARQQAREILADLPILKP